MMFLKNIKVRVIHEAIHENAMHCTILLSEKKV